MKKAIAALMLCSAIFLCGCTGAQVQKSVEFKGETYLRNLPDGKPQSFYTAQNVYWAKTPRPGGKKSNMIIVYYSPNAAFLSKIEDDQDKGLRSTYKTFGRTIKKEDFYALSFLGKREDVIAYSILKIRYNDVYGLNSSQIFIDIPGYSESEAQKVIEELDKKYFDDFIKFKNTDVYDKNNKKLPAKTTYNFLTDEYVLKLSRSQGETSALNIYLLENENFFKYNSSLIVVKEKLPHAKTVNDVVSLIENQYKIYTGYKELTKEIKNNGAIFSFMSFVLDKGKEYVRYEIYKISCINGILKALHYNYDFPKTPDYEEKCKGLDLKYVKYLEKEKIREALKGNFGIKPEPLTYEKMYYYKGIKR